MSSLEFGSFVNSAFVGPVLSGSVVITRAQMGKSSSKRASFTNDLKDAVVAADLCDGQFAVVANRHGSVAVCVDADSGGSVVGAELLDVADGTALSISGRLAVRIGHVVFVATRIEKRPAADADAPPSSERKSKRSRHSSSKKSEAASRSSTSSSKRAQNDDDDDNAESEKASSVERDDGLHDAILTMQRANSDVKAMAKFDDNVLSWSLRFTSNALSRNRHFVSVACFRRDPSGSMIDADEPEMNLLLASENNVAWQLPTALLNESPSSTSEQILRSLKETLSSDESTQR